MDNPYNIFQHISGSGGIINMRCTFGNPKLYNPNLSNGTMGRNGIDNASQRKVG